MAYITSERVAEIRKTLILLVSRDIISQCFIFPDNEKGNATMEKQIFEIREKHCSDPFFKNMAEIAKAAERAYYYYTLADKEITKGPHTRSYARYKAKERKLIKERERHFYVKTG